MRFSEWVELKESEQLATLPDAAEILYTCCVLHKNSQTYLIGLVRRWMMEGAGVDIPKGWTGRAHHMTIRFRPKKADIEALSILFGKPVTLTVTDWAFDDQGIAVVVEPSIALPVGQQPHVTIAHSREVGAVYSNTLLANMSKWRPVHENVQLESFVVGVKHDNVSVWPELPEPLAAPSLLM